MSKISIAQGLAWKKMLQDRYKELAQLRNENSRRMTSLFGDKEITQEPLYDPIELDKTLNSLAREIRLLDESIKETNAKTALKGYERNEDVLGQLAPYKK